MTAMPRTRDPLPYALRQQQDMLRDAIETMRHRPSPRRRDLEAETVLSIMLGAYASHEDPRSTCLARPAQECHGAQLARSVLSGQR